MSHKYCPEQQNWQVLSWTNMFTNYIGLSIINEATLSMQGYWLKFCYYISGRTTSCHALHFAVPSCWYNTTVLDKTDEKQIENGDTLNLNCDDGYYLKGTSSVTCVGGDWSNPLPTCEVKPSKITVSGPGEETFLFVDFCWFFPEQRAAFDLWSRGMAAKNL